MLRVRRLVPLVLISACLACSDSEPSGPGEPQDSAPPDVAGIRVQAPGSMLWDIGESLTLSASAVDADGDPIPGVVLEWTSTDSGVASVSDGVVTARGDGLAAVQVSAARATGSVFIVVVTAGSPTDRSDCMGCHILEYDARHGGSATPATCLMCHSGPTWAGAGVDHPAVANGFELLGAHATAPCAACHAADGEPLWPGVADDECFACHQAEYDGQHGDSGYPTTCLTCHDRDAWVGATFDHDADYFPIGAGRHQGGWTGCPICHVDPADFTAFSCFGCHAHDESRMDPRHAEVAGYAYDSALCYACHPRGEAD